MDDNFEDKAAKQLLNFGAEHANNKDRATNAHGKPVSTKTASMTVGPQGPLLLQDTNYFDEIAAFDRERIPERVVHAKGAGAFGYFEVTHDISKYTKACIFNKVGKQTPLAVRFSTVIGERGAPDTARDPRGFAVKFYTEEGIWDLVGNNTPIFFIRDPILFPSFIHSLKRNPQTNLKDVNAFWDFATLRPETCHQMSFLFGDRGTPDGFRHMNGYGSHTFKLVNAEGKAVWCKFHFKTDQGAKNLPADVAGRKEGDDPDYATKDLYNAIANNKFPTWTFYIQVMELEEAERVSFNPFDVTKIWPHKQFPLIQVGKIVLNRNPTNYFAQVEQIAFTPSNMIPGIEPSPDKMLQGRLVSYTDTHRHRLGPNYHLLPVNRCPFAQTRSLTNRDGFHCSDDNQGGMPNYFPNSFSGVHVDPSVASQTITASGECKRFESGDEDNFSQVGDFWNKVLDDSARKRLVSNMANHMSAAAEFLQQRAIENFSKCDPKYGSMLKEALEKMKKPDVQTKPNF